MSKYDPLSEYLANLPSNIMEKTLTFYEIERILGDYLPMSASAHDAFWANPTSKRDHPHAQSWLSAGWKVESHSLNDKWVMFTRSVDRSEVVQKKQRISKAIKLNVGVIGAGGIARNVHLPSLADMDDIQVVAICDLVRERAVAMADTYSIPHVYTLFREMLAQEDLDAVFVLVEPASLFHVVWACLDEGLPVFMEKPPGITLYQAETLARKAEETGHILQVGFNRRHIPLVRQVVDMVRQRTQVTQVEGCFFKYGDAAFDRGSLTAFMSDTIHAIDLMRWMAGGTPEAAALVVSQHDSPVVNAWNGVCRFDNGVVGTLKANYRTGGRVHTFEVHGPGVSGYIELGFGGASCNARVLAHEGEMRYSLSATGAAQEGILELDGMALAGSTDFYKYYGFYQEDRHFLDCVRSGAEPETSIADAVESMRLAELFLANVI